MVRCDDFYRKWQKAGNFCEKHPETAREIEAFLDKIIPILEKEVSKSEVLAPEKPAMAEIVSERACRPLISEKSPEVRKEAIQQIVKAAEEKVIDGKRPQVTNKEVSEIVQTIKAKPAHKSQFNQTNDNIEWAPYSWNPVVGCKMGCPYCYARDIAVRFYEDFEPRFKPERLDAPGNTPLPKSTEPGSNNVFVCSMADLFGDWVPEEWISEVLGAVQLHPEWNFLFLTKNPKRLPNYIWPKNAWVGTTVDCQARVKAAEEAFKDVNASVKFLSCEPMRERLVFSDLSMFHWIIIGGQSANTKMQEFQPEWDWVTEIILKARENDLKIYFKPNLRPARLREYPA